MSLYDENEKMEGSEEMHFEADFNMEEDYTPPVLLRPGTYSGTVVDVTWDSAQQALVWRVAIESDEEEYYGKTLFTRNWFPKATDRNEMSKDGRTTKFQSKLRMLHDFSSNMGVDLGTPAKVREGIESGLWIGIPVFVKVKLREYEGRVTEDITKMWRQREG